MAFSLKKHQPFWIPPPFMETCISLSYLLVCISSIALDLMYPHALCHPSSVTQVMRYPGIHLVARDGKTARPYDPPLVEMVMLCLASKGKQFVKQTWPISEISDFTVSCAKKKYASHLGLYTYLLTYVCFFEKGGFLRLTPKNHPNFHGIFYKPTIFWIPP